MKRAARVEDKQALERNHKELRERLKALESRKDLEISTRKLMDKKMRQLEQRATQENNHREHVLQASKPRPAKRQDRDSEHRS